MHYVILRNFLKAAECEEIINLGNQRQLVHSTGFDVNTGESRQSDYRTSYQSFFQRGETPLIAQLEERIAELTGTPVENGEGFQIIRYNPGGYYKPHHDYFPPNFAGSQKVMQHGGQRKITFMIYLNTVPEGGGGQTSFFQAYPPFMVRPEEGKALLFFDIMPNHEVDVTTMHEALPVKEPYTKYTLQKWIHVGATNF